MKPKNEDPRGALLTKATDAAAFVLDEISRVSSLSVQDRIARLREREPQALRGFLWGHPDFSPLECGSDAAERFEEIVDFAQVRHPELAEDCSRRTLHRALVFAFAERYVRQRRPVDAGSVSSIVDGASRHVKKALVGCRIALPCRMWAQSAGPNVIEIGPVTFMSSDRFLADPTIGWPDLYHEQVQSAREFASKVGWIAVVELPPTDQAVALARAENASDTALNVLRLLLGADRTRRLRRASSWGPVAQHSHFIILPDGSASLSATYGGDDEIMWDNWPDYVFGGDRSTVRLWAGAAIRGVTHPRECVPLQQRYLDALKWYGDAAAETSEAGRLIKCVFSWERLVITGTRQVLETTVVERASQLCELTAGDRGESVRRGLGRLYELRSRLAHGFNSPFAQHTLVKAARECEAVTERVLFGALVHYARLVGVGATDEALEDSFTT